jgi:hypothetical protein
MNPVLRTATDRILAAWKVTSAAVGVGAKLNAPVLTGRRPQLVSEIYRSLDGNSRTRGVVAVTLFTASFFRRAAERLGTAAPMR